MNPVEFVVLPSDARTMNLVIYRCKAFMNRMKNMMIKKQKLPGGGKEVTEGPQK